MLASALTLVATEGGALRGTVVLGVFGLGVFGLGAAAVLVAAAYASRAGFGRVRGWVLAHMDRVKRGFGLLVLGLGVAILPGGDKWLEARLLQVLPQGWIDLTTRF
jgi:cytochrome c biogenesis protein CcdA